MRYKYSAICLYPYTKDTTSPQKRFFFVALVILELALKSMLALKSRVLLASASKVLELKGVDHHHLAQEYFLKPQIGLWFEIKSLVDISNSKRQ